MLHQQIHHRSFLAFAMLSLACVTAHAATGDDLLVPFVTGAVPRDKPFFPWRTLNLHPCDNAWGIGSSGLPGESPYHRPDGSRE